MSQPLLSVCVPAYNHERYVETTVRSILAQEGVRLELVVVDDGSTDGTRKVLDRLRPECERCFERVEIVTQPNQGVCAAHLRLLELARGDFVAMIASDDAYVPGALAALMKPLEEDPHLGVTVGINEIMDGEGRTCYWDAQRNIVYDRSQARYLTFNDYLSDLTDVSGDSSDFGTYAALLRCNHVPNGYVMRRTALDRVTPYRRDAPLDDFWLHLQLSKVAGYRQVPQTTFRYRWHAANTIKQTDRILRLGYETLKCEERTVAEMDDGNWARVFKRVTQTEEVRFRLGTALEYAKVSTLESKFKVLRLFGHAFPFARRSRVPGLPNA